MILIFVTTIYSRSRILFRISSGSDTSDVMHMHILEVQMIHTLWMQQYIGDSML